MNATQAVVSFIAAKWIVIILLEAIDVVVTKDITSHKMENVVLVMNFIIKYDTISALPSVMTDCIEKLNTA